MEELGSRLNEEMKRVHHELEAAMERVGAEVQRAMEEFHRGPEGPTRADKRRKNARPVHPTRPKPDRPLGKKRPRRRPPGTAAAPVKPKPKPTPLMDGAEAPVD